MRRKLTAVTAGFLFAGLFARAVEPPETQAGLEARLKAATAAVEAKPEDPDAYRLRAAIYSARDDHGSAVADLDRAIALTPDSAALYDERGSQQFMAGHIEDSIRDFDRAIALRPELEKGHWKRGISYYYAARYDDGRRQFEGYQQVDDNDVENAVWRFLCMARGSGLETARQAILPIRQDRRVPMMTVYDLFRGTAKESDVFEACQAGSSSPDQLNQRLFYAHLYVGLYQEAAGNSNQAREYLTAAVKRRIPHYMWDVARVHAARLNAAAR
jgi:lipoprotein NlpI